MKAKIDSNRCVAQLEICRPIKECPSQAIVYQEDPEAMLGFTMKVDRDLCKGCGTCMTVCCGEAITLIE